MPSLTDFEKQTILDNWPQLTAREIAMRLPGRTTNSVIGHIDRLRRKGFIKDHPFDVRKQKRVAPVVKPPKAERVAAAPTPRKAKASQPPKPPHALDGVGEVPVELRVQLQDTRDNQCRWIYGEPRSGHYHYCHLDRVRGLSWCENHALKGYRLEGIKALQAKGMGLDLNVAATEEKETVTS